MAGTIKHEWNGTILTITSDSGTSSADLKGAKGDDGARGVAGAAGGTCYNVFYTPTNILDNSNFQIAQAGYNAMHGSTKYVCDRWVSWDKDIILNDGYITPQSPIDQRFYMTDAQANKKHTLVIYKADGTITFHVGTPVNAFGTYATGYCGVSDAATKRYMVRIGTGHNVKAVALYEGEYTVDTIPAYHSKGYAAELLECQRYYIKIATQPVNGWAYYWGRVSAFVPLPVKMRATNPTIKLAQETPNFYIGSNSYPATLGSGTSVENGVVIYYTHTAELSSSQCIIPEFAAEIVADL